MNLKNGKTNSKRLIVLIIRSIYTLYRVRELRYLQQAASLISYSLEQKVLPTNLSCSGVHKGKEGNTNTPSP